MQEHGRDRKTNKAEYARSVVVQILKNESVEDTIIAGCGCTIEEMFLEAEEKLRKILEEKGRNTENEKTLH